MKTRLSLLVVLSLLLMSSMIGLGQAQGPVPQGIVGTAFTYQGQLKQNGLPVSGTCDFRFSLWDAETDGSQVGATLEQSTVAVSRGLFTVLLDFGPYAFNGDARYLGIDVRCPAGAGDYTPLAPRQALTPAPYAIFAASAPWAGLLNRPAGLDDGDDDTLAKLMCAPGQVAKWNGTTWACAADEDSQPVYTAGDGLVLAGNQFSVAFAGTGTATTAARSDHDHDAAYVNEGQPNSITSAMIWDGAVTVWDLRDGAVTAVKIADGATLAEILDDDGAGSGLDADLLDGHDSVYFQRRIEGTCPAGSSIRTVNADGTVVCETDDDTTYSAGNQLSLVGTRFNVLEGSGSGLDADLLDGLDSTAFAPVIHTHNAANIISGMLSTDRFSAYADLGAEGYLGDAAGDLAQNNGTLQATLNADLLDGQHGDFYQQRVSGTCFAGSSIRTVNTDGTVVCETDDDTTYSAGNQLSLVGTRFNVLEGSGSGLDADLLDGHDSVYFQRRIEGTCTAGSSIRTVNADGTVTCEPDDNTTYTAGTGLSLSGNQFSVNTAVIQARVTGSCSSGNAIRVINADGTVTCEPDDNTTYTAGTGLSLNGNQFSLATSYQLPQTCTNGQVAQWNGSAWTCASGGSGDITAVSAGTGLTGGGASGDVTLAADTNYLQRRVSGACPAGQYLKAINADGSVTCAEPTVTIVTSFCQRSFSDNYGDCLAQCSAGTIRIGGGCETEYATNGNFMLTKSMPAGPDGWMCTYARLVPSGVSWWIKAYITCLQVP